MANRNVRGRRGERGGRGAAPINPNDPVNFGVVLEDQDHRTRWNTLVQLECIPSRYPDDAVLAALGINDDVWELCRWSGVIHILTGNWHSYRRMMLEFLSTFKLNKSRGRLGKIESMSFQLDNRQFTMTVQELNTLFRNECPSMYEREWDQNIFWRSLTRVSDEEADTNFTPRTAKASLIRNPVFRFVQRACANSLFARYDGGNVTTRELYYLWCALREENFNLGLGIAEHLQRAALKRSGTLMCGGIITPIATYCNVDFAEWEVLEGNMLLSFDVLINMDFIRVDRAGRCFFTQKQAGHFPLPNSALTSVTDWNERANWRMISAAHLAAIQACIPLMPFRARVGNIVTDEVEVDETEQYEGQADTTGGEGSHVDMDAPSTSRAGGRRRNRPRSTEERLDDLEGRMSSVESEMQGLRGEFNQMNSNVGTINTNVAAMLQMMQQWGLQFPPNPPPS